jgi:hypothetical protein
MLLNKLNYDIIEAIFNNLHERKDVYNFLLINKYFNDFKNNFNCRVIKIIFIIQKWFNSKYIKEMEIIEIIIWCKEFLHTINNNEKKLLNHILSNKSDSILINNNLHKEIIHKKYKYRKRNRSYRLTAYNIIDICLSNVLNMI